MEKGRKNRMALVGILLIAGLLMAGAGTALGAGKVFQGMPVVFGAAVDQNGTVILDRDGKVVQTFVMPDVPEGETYSWETSSGRITIHNMTGEEIEKVQAKHEKELNRLLEIAKKDTRVQELIAEKDYKVVGTGQSRDYHAGTYEQMLTLDIEGKYYKITIDMNSEIVTSVDETSSVEQNLGKIMGATN